MLYLVPPGGASMVDAGGEYFIFWLSRAQENVFLDAFSKNFVFASQMFFCSAEKWMGNCPPAPLRLVVWALLKQTALENDRN